MASVTADISAGSYRTEIRAGNHSWVADEPSSLGGTDEGPNPYELLLGAIASCTTITLSMYAQRKGIKLDSVSVKYDYEKIHADDCESCDESDEGFVDHVTSQIFIEGEFTEAERERLAGIARRCPVHRTVEQGIHFNETLVVG